MKKLTVGVDIGGTNTVSGLVDNEGKCYGTLSFKTKDFVGPQPEQQGSE